MSLIPLFLIVGLAVATSAGAAARKSGSKRSDIQGSGGDAGVIGRIRASGRATIKKFHLTQ